MRAQWVPRCEGALFLLLLLKSICGDLTGKREANLCQNLIKCQPRWKQMPESTIQSIDAVGGWEGERTLRPELSEAGWRGHLAEF